MYNILYLLMDLLNDKKVTETSDNRASDLTTLTKGLREVIRQISFDTRSTLVRHKEREHSPSDVCKVVTKVGEDGERGRKLLGVSLKSWRSASSRRKFLMQGSCLQHLKRWCQC